MSKRTKVLVSLLVAILLMVAIPATMVMGQEDEDETTTAPQLRMRDAVLNKVAEVLGISAEDLSAAFEQAMEEQRDQIRSQATDNCSAYPECAEEFRERRAEKRGSHCFNEGFACRQGYVLGSQQAASGGCSVHRGPCDRMYISSRAGRGASARRPPPRARARGA